MYRMDSDDAKFMYSATEAPSDFFEFIGAIQINLSIYLSLPSVSIGYLQ